MGFIGGKDRAQIDLLPAHIEDYVARQAFVRIVDAFVASLDLVDLGFNRSIAAETGRPGYDPGDMPRLYIWGYLNQVRSSRRLERACVRDPKRSGYFENFRLITERSLRSATTIRKP